MELPKHLNCYATCSLIKELQYNTTPYGILMSTDRGQTCVELARLIHVRKSVNDVTFRCWDYRKGTWERMVSSCPKASGRVDPSFIFQLSIAFQWIPEKPKPTIRDFRVSTNESSYRFYPVQIHGLHTKTYWSSLERLAKQQEGFKGYYIGDNNELFARILVDADGEPVSD